MKYPVPPPGTTVAAPLPNPPAGNPRCATPPKLSIDFSKELKFSSLICLLIEEFVDYSDVLVSAISPPQCSEITKCYDVDAWIMNLKMEWAVHTKMLQFQRSGE